MTKCPFPMWLIHSNVPIFALFSNFYIVKTKYHFLLTPLEETTEAEDGKVFAYLIYIAFDVRFFFVQIV